MRKQQYFSYQSGQSLLLMTLVGVIALTVGIAVVSRSIVNSRAATEALNSQRALSAAEAGVQYSINSNSSNVSSPTSLQLGESIMSVQATSIGNSTNFQVRGGQVITKDDGEDVWLIDHDPTTGKPNFSQTPYTGPITISWLPTASSPDCGTSTLSRPALEVQVLQISRGNGVNPYYQPFGGPGPYRLVADTEVDRYAYDPCGATRASANNFTDVGTSTPYQTPSISLTNAYLIHITPIYSDAKIVTINARAGDTIPLQGTEYTSKGQSGDAQRTIQYYRGFPNLPGLFMVYVR